MIRTDSNEGIQQTGAFQLNLSIQLSGRHCSQYAHCLVGTFSQQNLRDAPSLTGFGNPRIHSKYQLQHRGYTAAGVKAEAPHAKLDLETCIQPKEIKTWERKGAYEQPYTESDH